MGYDLKSVDNGEYFRFNIHSWGHVLKIAEAGGWQPLGTKKPKGWQKQRYGEWDGGYRSNDGQIVSLVDALALADGLEAALDDIPDHRTSPLMTVYANTKVIASANFKEHEIEQYKRYHDTNAGDEVTCLFDNEWERGTQAPTILIITEGFGFDESSIDYWSGVEHKDYLRRFVEFCRLGAFVIR